MNLAYASQEKCANGGATVESRKENDCDEGTIEENIKKEPVDVAEQDSKLTDDENVALKEENKRLHDMVDSLELQLQRLQQKQENEQVGV